MPQEAIKSEISLLPLKVVGLYLGVGACWILFSDALLGRLVSDPQILTEVAIVKGWFFLLVTGTLLFMLIRRGLAIISANNAHLASREEHYRMLFERMQNGFAIHEIICSDAGKPIDYRFLEFNPGYEKLTGLKAEDLVGRTAREIFPALEPFWIETYGKVALTGEPANFGGYLQDLGRYYEVSAFSTGKGRFAVVCWDVTEKRLVEMELNKLHGALEERVAERTAQLVETNQMLKQEIGQRLQAEEEVSWLNADLLRQKAELEAVNHELEAFSFSVSHDLRAPLRNIVAFTELLQEEQASLLDEMGRNYLDRIARSCLTMGALIDDLLELARISRTDLHMKKLNLSAMAQAVADELRLSEPEREVVFDIAPGVEALGDETLIRIVLQNLLENAYKYTGKKATARIEFGARMREGKQVIFVRDNGAGFDMHYAEKLFGAFQRLHRREEFEGTGVGLAIVQRIVHRHGGQIEGEGVPGEGATFSFTLGH